MILGLISFFFLGTWTLFLSVANLVSGGGGGRSHAESRQLLKVKPSVSVLSTPSEGTQARGETPIRQAIVELWRELVQGDSK